MDRKPFQKDAGKAASPLQPFASLFLLLKCCAGKSSVSLERRLGNLASFPKAEFTRPVGFPWTSERKETPQKQDPAATFSPQATKAKSNPKQLWGTCVTSAVVG